VRPQQPGGAAAASLFVLLLLAGFFLGGRIGGRGETVGGLVPQPPWVVEAAHLGEEQALHFRKLRGVAGVAGEVHLFFPGLHAGQGHHFGVVVFGEEFVRVVLEVEETNRNY